MAAIGAGTHIATLSAAHTIVETGDEAIRQTWLPRLASGAVSAAVTSNTGPAQPDPLWRPEFLAHYAA